MTAKYQAILLPVFAVLLSAWGTDLSDDREHGPFDPCQQDAVSYSVEFGDHLYSIAVDFGSVQFWEALYIANADQINNPDLIFEGQELRIPRRISMFRESQAAPGTVLSNPFCTLTGLPLEEVDEQFIVLYDMDQLKAGAQNETEQLSEENAQESELTDEEKLEAFRKAFEAVTSQNEVTEAEENQQQTEQQMFVEIDGMIHDDTRSKVGRDFYDVFYANWQAPEEASHFSIRISEQPTPNMGTMVSVHVNDAETFQTRLQPRYDFIEEAGRYAVRMSYLHLQNNQQQFQIY
jgi:hypothetical protein